MAARMAAPWCDDPAMWFRIRMTVPNPNVQRDDHIEVQGRSPMGSTVVIRSDLSETTPAPNRLIIEVIGQRDPGAG